MQKSRVWNRAKDTWNAIPSVSKCYAVVIGAFAVAGAMIGWYVGASESPVVATLIPLLFGLVAAFTVAFLNRHKRDVALHDTIEHLEVDTSVKNTLKTRLSISDRIVWIPAVYAAGVIVFCISCYVGTKWGLASREPLYPSTASLLKDAGIDTSQLDPLKVAQLEQLRWRMAERRIPIADAKAVYARVIKDTLDNEDYRRQWNKYYALPPDDPLGRYYALNSAISHLLYQVKGKSYLTSTRSEEYEFPTQPPIPHRLTSPGST